MRFRTQKYLKMNIVGFERLKTKAFKVSTLTAVIAVGVTGVPVAARGPTLCVTAAAADPGCTLVGVPKSCPGVVAVPPSIMVFYINQ